VRIERLGDLGSAPSLEAVAVDDVFAVPTGESDGPIGGGWSDCVLRQDRDGQWWYESLSGATLSGWVVSIQVRGTSVGMLRRDTISTGIRDASGWSRPAMNRRRARGTPLKNTNLGNRAGTILDIGDDGIHEVGDGQCP
jgi:hypothetical protein